MKSTFVSRADDYRSSPWNHFSNNSANVSDKCEVARASTHSPQAPSADYTVSLLLEKSLVRTNRGGQVSVGMASQARAFRFEPIDEDVGQTMKQVLGKSSFLDVELAGRDPRTTTITVSVYEDSYAELRQLKEYLYSRGGFATAARPLLDNQQIVFSPTGTASKAQ